MFYHYSTVISFSSILAYSFQNTLWWPYQSIVLIAWGKCAPKFASLKVKSKRLIKISLDYSMQPFCCSILSVHIFPEWFRHASGVVMTWHIGFSQLCTNQCQLFFFCVCGDHQVHLPWFLRCPLNGGFTIIILPIRTFCEKEAERN